MTTSDSLQPTTPPASAALAQTRMGTGEDLLGKFEGPPPVECDISPRAVRSAFAVAHERQPGEPLYRPLRIYTRDPTLSRQHGSVTTINVPYEPLSPGPCSSLLKVVDEGACAERTPTPVELLNLDDPFLMIEQGLSPSPSDSRFRAQMVYAVCTTTYAAFRQALGRDLTWGFTRGSAAKGPSQLRVRSSYAEDTNAYYDPQAGELRFGAFVAVEKAKGNNIPYGLVYTALQHDVVVHEMSHALLDGLRAHLLTPTNSDVYALHEAFADLVALFQRFTYENVVRAGLRASRGDVRKSPLLTDFAVQFSQAMGRASALRSAVSGTERCHGDSEEPHERGEVLALAIFETFATVYERKTHRAVRLATGGTGILPPGELPDLLLDELTGEARKLAAQFLAICIRAIDYCPPLDVTFGEYLRAMITADVDLVPDDPWLYRETLIDAFRRYGIYPRGVNNLSEETLRWRPPEVNIAACEPLSFGTLRFRGEPGRPADLDELNRQAVAFGQLASNRAYMKEFGLVAPGPSADGQDTFARPIVESIRTARRAGPDGQIVFDLVAEVIQRRTVRPSDGSPGFEFYGGSTVILDPAGKVRYAIRKRVDDDLRLKRQAQFIAVEGADFWTKTRSNRLLPQPQPFRFLHSPQSGNKFPDVKT